MMGLLWRINTSLLLALFLSGCDIFPVNSGVLEGRVWCDVRYLDLVPKHQEYHASISNIDNDSDYASFRKRLRLSKAGYMYVVAATLPLQNNDVNIRYHFDRPERLREIYDLRRYSVNGFEAMTFILYDENNIPIKTVISFGGSNQIRDYLLHNFWILPVQYDDARNYVQEVSRHPDTLELPIVAVGISLGGGLAVHVKKQDVTGLVEEAWAFNSSPRAGANGSQNSDIHLLANKREILNLFPRTRLGALPQNTDTNFDLINSSSIYAHYRWVLARQILHYADLAIYFDAENPEALTEPMKILQSQKISGDICSENLRDQISRERAKT
ncbi:MULTISPECIES: hypothetical protein [unclassified Halomonas]|uniref:hypothetical protein n=1 Tax=unclassified Halomonas TaxID=2609666 RepID=UPI000F67833C|nr:MULTISPECIES: hypothetical protein [unclassified Halomonas]MBT2788035.1 hypothetical protein [Halomonas sp. ISL-106]MBT2795784.1 hypothetical protein [Halomonas sp. ISL-104]